MAKRHHWLIYIDLYQYIIFSQNLLVNVENCKNYSFIIISFISQLSGLYWFASIYHSFNQYSKPWILQPYYIWTDLNTWLMSSESLELISYVEMRICFNEWTNTNIGFRTNIYHINSIQFVNTHFKKHYKSCNVIFRIYGMFSKGVFSESNYLGC